MRAFFVLILLFIFFSGCGESLRTLLEIDREQKEQQQYAAIQRRKFHILLKDIQRNRLKIGQMNSSDIIKRYGEPIMRKDMDDGQIWLYREPLEFFPIQKVYLFFNKEGILKDFKIESKDS